MKTRHGWLVAFGIGLAFLMVFPWGRFFTEKHARHVADISFRRYCASAKIDPALYEGPHAAVVGNAVWAFEWTARPPARSPSIGVWLSFWGTPNLYIGNEEK
jgi:hypothetical protein